MLKNIPLSFVCLKAKLRYAATKSGICGKNKRRTHEVACIKKAIGATQIPPLLMQSGGYELDFAARESRVSENSRAILVLCGY